MAIIRIEYFAVLREHVGCAQEDLRTAATTVGELYAELDGRYAFPAVGRVKVAVNDEFRDWERAAAGRRLRSFHSPRRRRVSHFAFSREPFTPERYRALVSDPVAGGYSSFEGRVRNHNEGRGVVRLEYEAYEALGLKEGDLIVAEAFGRFPIAKVHCVHRLGMLDVGDLAVWVGVTAVHRDAAFAACRYIIDEVKTRVPIWKKEHYAEGDSGWINCEVRAAGVPAGSALP